ncbi:Gldg family protein [Mucilaginibacter sp. SG564]|uniref:Gldg family protein n=1 Tax=Mucilaginibacter sp. SG564 TaxID=2587022 RepID=UPI00155642AD|nr:Gldg family protein [Mucilaginibacter sp. SG564]NOW96010.1 ABC-2 type transport system permease protein [Mucilaginibacter sp. SG564]
MNITIKVAKNELRNLFYSPIAWFLAIAFFVQCGVEYTKLLGQYASLQEEGGRSLDEVRELTNAIFTSRNGLFPAIIQNLYLYIPLLTMGLISREINIGTISLLYSSPVKIREIVFGKYLAMLCYNLMLVLIIGVFLFAGVLDIKSVDVGILLSAAFGFYLLLATYSAIGLFMSSLISYQIVSAVSTFVMIGILSRIGTLWQGIDFVRDLTYFLSISGRAENMLHGLISTKDVIYFVLIIFIFLGLSISKLQFGREVRAWFVKAGRYALIVGLALFIGYVTSSPALIAYWDTSANKSNTLTPVTQKILNQFGSEPLEITVYSNYLDGYGWYGLPEQRKLIYSLWEPYIRFKPDIKFNFVNYYDRPLALQYSIFKSYPGKTMSQIVAKRAKADDIDTLIFKTPEQIQKIIDLKPELNRFVMQVKYKNRSTFLRVFDDQLIWPSEYEASAAFKRLLQADMPKIGFITGDGERNSKRRGDRDYRNTFTYKVVRSALVNQGFDVDTIDLNTQQIPSNLSILVLADPRKQLTKVAQEKIAAYMAKGGNMLFAGEPGRQQWINPLLQPLGVELADGMLEQKSEDDPPSLVFTYLTKNGIGLSKRLSSPGVDTLPISFKGTSFLKYHETSGFKVAPLFVTKPSLVTNTSAINPDLSLAGNVQPGDGQESEESPNTVIPGSAQAKAKENDLTISKPEQYFTAVSLEKLIGGKKQRIIVAADADFLSNAETQRYDPRTINPFVSSALFSWLDNGRFPIDASRPVGQDDHIKVSTDRVKVLKIWYIWVLPAIALLFSSILLIRRKRK